MRVAVFCNDYWPTIGGVQTGVRGLTAALKARGHEALIVTHRPEACAPWEIVDGTAVWRVDWSLRPLRTLVPRAVRARAHVRAVLRDWAAEAAYVHFVSVDGVFALDVARRMGIPLVLSFRGNDALVIAERNVVTRRIYAALTGRAAANLYCSPWLKAQVCARPWYRGTPARSGVLADAVDVERRVRAEEPGPFVLAPGRLVPKKGFDLLVQAWARVAGSVGVPLVIAGDGPERPALERLARSLRVEGSVRFVGAVPHERLLGLMEAAVLCVVPSRQEPYGIVLVEAQALGTPLLATAVDNIPELVADGETGYLAAPSAEGLAAGILRAWRDPARAAVAVRARGSVGATRSYARMAEELERWLAAA